VIAMNETAIIQGLTERIAPQLGMGGLLVAWKYLEAGRCRIPRRDDRGAGRQDGTGAGTMKNNFKINESARRDMLCPNDDGPDREREEERLEQQFEQRRLEKIEAGGDEE